jgi:hypothetical protein
VQINRRQFASLCGALRRRSLIVVLAVVMLMGGSLVTAPPASADTVGLQINQTIITGTPPVQGTSATVLAGEPIRYVLSYSCVSTSAPCRNVQVIDSFPPELYIVSVSNPTDVALQTFDRDRPWPPGEQSQRQHNAHGTARFTMIDPLPAGRTGQIIVDALLPGFYTPDGTTVTNQATIRGSNAATVTSGTTTVTAHADSTLSLSKYLLSGGAVDGISRYQISACSQLSTYIGGLAFVDNYIIDTLPPGAVFVPELSSGTEISPGVIRTELGDLTYSNCAGANISVRYPSSDPSNTIGASKLNTASLYGHHFGSIPTTLLATANATTTLTAPQVGGNISKWVNAPRYTNSGYYGATFGERVSYSIGGSNSGTADWTSAVYSDDIPPQVNVTDATIGYGSPGPRSWEVWFTSRDNPTLRLAAESTSYVTVNFRAATLPSGEVGLAPSDQVSRLEIHLTGVTSQNESPIAANINAIVNTSDRNGAMVNVGDLISNIATLDAQSTAGPLHSTAGATFIVDTLPVLPTRVDHFLSAYYTAARNEVGINGQISMSTGPGADPKAAVLVPAGLTVTGWAVNNADLDMPQATVSQRPVGDGSGRTLVVISFPPGTIMPKYASTYFQLRTSVSPQASFNLSIDSFADLATAPFECGSLLAADTFDIDGDSNTTEQVCEKQTTITLASGASAAVATDVQGSLDSGLMEGPAIGSTTSAAGDRFQIRVVNTSEVPLDHVVVVDVLPRANDTGVTTSEPRNGPNVQADLTGPVTPSAPATVWYSTVANPCRAEVGYTPAGCVDPAWSTTLPVAPASVTAVKVAFTGQLDAGQTLSAELPVTLPASIPFDTPAFNSAGLAASRVDNGTALLPTESVKAGLERTTGILIVAGKVFADTNGNSLNDSGELGLAGVDVSLFVAGLDGTLGTPDDVIIASAKTAADGSYQFASRRPGTYRVAVSTPPTAKLVPTFDLDGGRDDSTIINLATSRSDVNFGEASRSIGNFVWSDVNLNGRQDAGEFGIDGLTVELIEGTLTIASTTTGDDPTTPALEHGFYRFSGLTKDQPYSIRVVAPGYVPTAANAIGDDRIDSDLSRTGLTDSVTLSASVLTNDTLDAGLVPLALTGSISGATWWDANGDGQRQPGEPNLPTKINYVASVSLLGAGPDDQFGTLDDTYMWRYSGLRTAADGTYNATGLAPGRYRVRFEGINIGVPTGTNVGNPATDSDALSAASTDPNGPAVRDTADLVVVAGATLTNVDGGFRSQGSVGDRIWIDQNANGIQDVGEPYAPQILVTVHGAGPDGLFDTADDFLRPQYSQGDAGYKGDGLADGVYRLEVSTLIASYGKTFRLTLNGQGANRGADSDIDPATGQSAPFTLPLASAATDLDIGLVPAGTASIGDRIWKDLDTDGLQDVGEPGYPSQLVTLVLFGPDGVLGNADDVSINAFTDANGGYRFDGLPSGKAIIRTYVYNGTYSPQGVGSDRSFDSDVNPLTRETNPFDIIDGQTRTDLDIGTIAYGSIGDDVFVDENRNGIRDPGELGAYVSSLTLRGSGPDDVFGTADDAIYNTAANQSYAVPNLPPGRYIASVPQTVSDGSSIYSLAALHVGNDRTIDSDFDPTTGTSDIITLGLGQKITDLDIGLVTGDASVGNFVWNDVNGNGLQDIGEPGIANATMNLLWAGADGVLDTADDTNIYTTTNPLGYYQFNGLPPGTYRLSTYDYEPGIGSRVGSPQLVGADRSIDSDFNPITNQTAPFTLTAGQADGDHDAGYQAGAAIGDRVWLDNNGNGLDDFGEPGVAGITVTVLGDGPDGVPGTFDDVNSSTTTDVDGNYLIGKLFPGTYRVRINPLAISNPRGTGGAFYNLTTPKQGTNNEVDSDFDPGSGMSAPITVGRAEEVSTIDAGLVPGTGVIGDRIWRDVNGNGIQDVGEPNQGYDIVSLESPGADGVYYTADDAGTISVQADANGRYQFTQLPAGTYRVRVGAGVFVLTSPHRGTDTRLDSDLDPRTFASDPIVLGPGDVRNDIDVGTFAGGLVGDFIWSDTNGNGVQDMGEPGVAGVTVTLTSSGTDGIPGNTDDDVRTTVSAADGSYTFTAVNPGTYTISVPPVVVVSGHGYSIAPRNSGTDTYADSDVDVTTGRSSAVTIFAGLNATDLDIGLVPGSASIGDRVWIDSNGNGLQNAGEPGLVGINVALQTRGSDNVFDTADDITLGSVTTTAAGSYAFTTLPPGRYRVVMSTTSSSLVVTPRAVGTDRTIDSDIDVTTLSSSPIDLVAGQSLNDIDAGFFVGGSLGDRVWSDRNGNGIQDLGEPGVAGVPVTIRGAGPNNTFGDADDTTETVSTLATGSWTVAGLRPDRYIVSIPTIVIDTLRSYHLTAQAQGSDRTLDSDVDPTTGLTAPIVVNSGDVLTAFDMGLLEDPGSIGDRVWNDLDGNGLQDVGEPSLANVNVSLLWSGIDGIFGNTDDATLSTASDTTGLYTFPNLTDGTYQLRVVPPAAFALTAASRGTDRTIDSDVNVATGLSSTITIAPGTRTTASVDVGLVRLSSFDGIVFDDRSGDGIRQAAEAGIEGVSLTLKNTTGTTFSATSGPGGTYQFKNIPAGTYTLTEVQPSAFDDGVETVGTGATTPGTLAPPDSVNGIVVGIGQTATGYQFAELARASLSGLVYEDVNGNGARDTEDNGIGDVLLTLVGQTGTSVTTRTSAAGTYHFVGLPAGRYTLTETQPPTHLDGSISVGTGFVSPGAAGGPNVVSNIVMTNGDDGVDYNFAEIVAAQLSGRVYRDMDGNGSIGTNESGIESVNMTLTDANGNETTVPTKPDGSFLFVDLTPGTYSLREAQPLVGFADGIDTLGTGATNAGVLSDDLITSIALGAGQRASNYLFGENPLASLAGVVFDDRSGDGFRQAAEAGIEGVSLTLTNTAGTTFSTTSGPGGTYQFKNIPADTYTLTELQPTAFDDGIDTVGTDATTPGTLAAPDSVTGIVIGIGETATGYQFAELPRSSLSGLVYADANGNSARDTNEGGISGVLLTLVGPTGTTVSARTNLSGIYRFADLPAGTYTLTQSQPTTHFDGPISIGTGFASPGTTTLANVVSGIVMTNGAEGVDYDFAELVEAQLSGRVYRDLDGNGKIGTNESGIESVNMTLTDANGNETTVPTKPDGSFLFVDLTPGTYSLREAQPLVGFADGIDTLGTGATNPGVLTDDSVTGIVLAGSQMASNYLFGESPLASLAGVVFDDVNGDGVQNNGERGIGGVIITLRSTSGVTQTTRTDDTGHYAFANLVPDTYDIEESQPVGFIKLGSIVGTGASKSGAIDPASANTVLAIQLSFGDNAVNYAFFERSTTPVVTTPTTTTPTTTTSATTASLPTTPVTTNPGTPSPTIDPAVTAPPRVPTRGLPVTGSDLRNVLTMASLLLAFGLTLFIVGRRRRVH